MPKLVKLGDCEVWGKDECSKLNLLVSIKKLLEKHDGLHPPEDVFRRLSAAMPTAQQFKLRYENKATNHILIELKWTQLDPFLTRTTRRKKTREEKRVLLSIWVVPKETHFEHRVYITTAPLENDNPTVIFDDKVENAFESILKQLLQPSGQALYVKDNICLRPIHSGMRLSLYDGKGFIHTEVLRIVVL